MKAGVIRIGAAEENFSGGITKIREYQLSQQPCLSYRDSTDCALTLSPQVIHIRYNQYVMKPK